MVWFFLRIKFTLGTDSFLFSNFKRKNSKVLRRDSLCRIKFCRWIPHTEYNSVQRIPSQNIFRFLKTIFCRDFLRRIFFFSGIPRAKFFSEQDSLRRIFFFAGILCANFFSVQGFHVQNNILFRESLRRTLQYLRLKLEKRKLSDSLKKPDQKISRYCPFK